MSIYTIFDEHGEMVRLLSCPPEMLDINVMPGETGVSGDWTGHYLDADGLPVLIPPAPSVYHRWDTAANAWAGPFYEEARAQVWERIKAERERRRAGGVFAGGYWFHSDESSRGQQLGLRMMGADLPPDLHWRTLGGHYPLMTPALAEAIFWATAALDQALFAVGEQHRAALAASTDPLAYDYSGGWPPSFGEGA